MPISDLVEPSLRLRWVLPLCWFLCAVGQPAATQAQRVTAILRAKVAVQLLKMPIVDGTGIRFAQLSTAGALPQTRVGQIIQDNQGFMWFATAYGLNRFDGYNFKLFTNDPGNPKSLGGVYITALFRDRVGALWVGCDRFLNRFDAQNETFTRYPVRLVRHIVQDDTGILWLSTPAGVYTLNPLTGRTLRYSHDPKDAASLSSNEIKSIGEDREGRLWVATTDGLDQFDRRKGKVVLHIPVHETSSGLSFFEDGSGTFWIYHISGRELGVFDSQTNTLTRYSLEDGERAGTALTGITTMLEDRSGTLWLATHGAGLLRFDRERRRFIRYRHNDGDPDSLPENSVESLFEDRDGSIWAGLGRTRPIRFATTTLPFKRIPRGPASRNNKLEPFVGAILEDRKGILWIGTPEALHRIDRKTGQYQSYSLTKGSAAATDVIAIREDQAGNFWVGTYGHGLLWFDRRTKQFKTYRHHPADPYSLSSDVVSRLLVDHNGTLWAATSNGLNRFDATTRRFITYRPDSQSANMSYLELVEDRDGALWLGAEFGGLQRFDPRSGRFTIYGYDMNQPGTLSDNRVNSVYLDGTGTIWVGTQNGLNKFDRNKGTFTAYTQRDGFRGNAVGCILADNRGDLWMSTNDGVARFDRRTNTVKDYSTSDGLPGPDLTGWGACFEAPNGEMFFGGFSGATSFFPDQISDTSYTPPVVLTDFRLRGNPVEIGDRSVLRKSIAYATDIVLSHQQNIFSLTFAALSYADPATNRYRYKLDGLQGDWTEVASDRRQAAYTTLPAGTYVFHAQGATSTGAWSQPGLALRIKILPAWWGTWWFMAISGIAFACLLWMFYLWRLRQLSERMRKQLEERKRAEEVAKSSERELSLIIDTMPGLVWCASPEGELTFMNRRILDYLGISEEKLNTAGWSDFLHLEDREMAVRLWSAAVLTGQAFEVQGRIRRADGIYQWIHSLGQLGRDRDGRPTRWYGLLIDIDDRKNMEAALRSTEARLSRATQVATMGELSASIAHEINQPLAAVVTNGQACLRWLAADPPNVPKAREAAERVVRDGKEAGEVVKRIRALFTRAGSEAVSLDLNEVISEVLRLLHTETIRRRVLVQVDLGAIPSVFGDRIQLQQLVLNLVVNALEAMDPVVDRSRRLSIRSQQTCRDMVVVEVQDSGVGLAEKDKSFDAFFTTKENGMGMGLAICRSVVEAHKGRIWAIPGDGSGTTFCFSLPVQ